METRPAVGDRWVVVLSRVLYLVQKTGTRMNGGISNLCCVVLFSTIIVLCYFQPLNRLVGARSYVYICGNNILVYRVHNYHHAAGRGSHHRFPTLHLRHMCLTLSHPLTPAAFSLYPSARPAPSSRCCCNRHLISAMFPFPITKLIKFRRGYYCTVP